MLKCFKGADIVFTFDTTGSMYPCLTQVRRTLKEMTTKLFQDIPNLRIGIIAHGDYCDANTSYVTNVLDLTSYSHHIIEFIEKVGPTGGGDSPECYELVLHKSRVDMNWSAGREKIVVMIGDDIPHHVGYLCGQMYERNKIDWKNELNLLLEANIHVYGVHCMPGIRSHSLQFYKEIARVTNGYYITLDQFTNITDLIMGICYRQMGIDSLEKFEKEVDMAGRKNRNINDSFRTMKGLTSLKDGPYYDNPSFKGSRPLFPVSTGRFQVIPIDNHPDPKAMEIRHFIERQGIMFKPGRGFYELTKPVEVQVYKEVILVDRRTGDIFNGPQVREMLGLMPQRFDITKGGEVERLRPVAFEKYKVFIQSTSFNRKLIPGTNLMYEVPDWDMETKEPISLSTEIKEEPKKVTKKVLSKKTIEKKEKIKKTPKTTPGELEVTETKIKASKGAFEGMYTISIDLKDSNGNKWNLTQKYHHTSFKKKRK